MGGIFEDIPVSSRLQGSPQIFFRFMNGQGNDLYGGMFPFDFSDGIHTGHTRHRQIHHHQFRHQLFNLAYCFATIGGFTDDFKFWISRKKGP